MLRLLAAVVRRRPKTALLALVLLLLAGTVAGRYAYALRQWHAAEAAVRENRLADARRNLDVCLSVWPHSVQAHLLAARVARLSGDCRGAEAHLNRCLTLSPDARDDVQLEFDLLRAQTGEADRVAPALMARVKKMHPERVLILETLSQAYMSNLRFGPAYVCLNRWIGEAPDQAMPHYWRGLVLERLGRSALALDDYRRALERDPGLFPARLRLTEILLDKAEVREALEHLDRLGQQAPDRPEVPARLGQARLLQGRREEARPLLESAVGKMPRDVRLLIDLGKLELQDERPAAAERWLRRALAVDPTETEARYQLVASLQGQGRREEAEAALAQCEKDRALLKRATRLLKEEMTHPSNNADALYQLGAVLLRSGQERQALYWLQRALEVNEAHQPANKALADYYEKKGDPKRAATYRSRISP